MNNEVQGVNKTGELSEVLEVLLRNYVNQAQDAISSKSYVGVVEDNNDPEKRGRCKIRVYAIFGESVQTTDLPWALPKNHAYRGSKYGDFVVPTVGTLVNVEFENQSVYAPRYESNVHNDNYLPEERLKDYPNTVVLWTSESGDSVTYNRKTNLYQFRHASGLVMQIDRKGNATVDTSVNSDCNITVITKGKVQFQSANVEVANDTGATVKPNPVLGGPFCALPNCVFSGAPHQGKNVSNCLVKHSDII